MRIRSITLDNVRRFTEPVRVGPLGEGISLLCQPNESGKSTLFDAIHALFFIKHTGAPKEIKALQPHAGGGVAVEMELDIGGAVWRIRKVWIQGREARVWRDGVLTHQGGEAEDWIAALTGGEGAGPAGLLWVRQGLVDLDGGGRGDLDARRDLFSSVVGAVDDVTGGRRMDVALATCRQELEALQTSTGRRRTGGRWAEAEDLVATLSGDEARLAGMADDLKAALDERRRLRRDLAGVTDADETAARERALALAKTSLEDAERHADRAARAETAARLADRELETARAEADRAEALRRELSEARAAKAGTEAEAATAAAALAQAEEAWQAARQALSTAQAAAEAAEAIRRKVERREAARGAVERRRELTERLGAAETADRLAMEQRAEAARGPDAAALARIEELVAARTTARAVFDATAPHVSVRYDAGAPLVVVDGRDLHPGESRPLRGDSAIALPGIGRMSIALAEADAAERVAQADEALAGALAAGGWDRPDAVRQAAQARAAAERQAADAAAKRDILAPEGLPALRDRLALLPAETGAEEALPDRAEADRDADAAAAALSAARQAEEAARTGRESARVAAAGAATSAGGAAERQRRAELAAAGLPQDGADAVADRLALLRQAAQAAHEAHRTLADDAPDLEAARSRVTRLARAAEEAGKEAGRLRERLAALDALIRTRAEEGVEESLADVRVRLVSAQEARDRVSFEVEVLRRLAEALESARNAARDRYFAPIAAELRPLLGLLWSDAEISWSDDSLLPETLTRDGRPEPVGILSGGTQEQIAFLVRLAFARLLARDGRHAPIILDDALVFSDDDRIVRMFDALHKIAGDIQIIVLSCRQRAFRELGAPQVRFEPVARDAPA